MFQNITKMVRQFQKNKVAIALNILYDTKRKKISPGYVSKHNSNGVKQVILLVIPNREGWRYLAAKNYQYYQQD